MPKFLKPLSLSPFKKNLSLIFTSLIDAIYPASINEPQKTPPESVNLRKFATLNSVDFHDEIKQSGSPESGWVILDLNSILIHCVTESARDFYKLDSIYEKYGVIHHH